MGGREQDRDDPEDLALPENESDDVKGGAGGGVWFLKNTNSPGAANEGAEPHLRSGDVGTGLTRGA